MKTAPKKEKDNRTNLKRSPIVKVKGSSVFAFSLLAVLFTAVEAFIIRACCSYCFGDVFRESFISSGEGLLSIAALALAMGIFGAMSVVISAGKRARR